MKYDNKTNRKNSQETRRCQDFRRQFSHRIKIFTKSFIKIKIISLFLQISKLFRFRFSSDFVHTISKLRRSTQNLEISHIHFFSWDFLSILRISHVFQKFLVRFDLSHVFRRFFRFLRFLIVVRQIQKKKKKKILRIFESHNNLKIDFLFRRSILIAIFVFFQKRSDCHENFRFSFVSFETSFFLNLSERKKKNETFRNIN
jgi:hypothetical protein